MWGTAQSARCPAKRRHPLTGSNTRTWVTPLNPGLSPLDASGNHAAGGASVVGLAEAAMTSGPLWLTVVPGMA